MASLSSLSGMQPEQNQGQSFIPPQFSPHLHYFDTSPPWLTPFSLEPDTNIKKSRKKDAKTHHRHRKEKRTKKRHLKRQIGAYILQLIGLVCLVLAAVKAFEPLTGVGFTLVIVGIRAGVGKKGDKGISLGGLLGMEKRHRKSKKKKVKESIEDEGKMLEEGGGDEEKT